MRIEPEKLEELLCEILIKHQTSPTNARCVAKALVNADLDGLHSHGAARLYAYAKQAINGKVDGLAVPSMKQPTPCIVQVDASGGFAYPAIELGFQTAAKAVQETGVVVLSIGQSHHSGAIGQFIEPLAREGLLVLAFSNATAAIAPAGGTKALFGTNPIAFACPRLNNSPMLIDLSLSKIARGKVKLAADAGQSIPEGWAIDTNGEPTTDAKAAISGSLVPIGDNKGASLAMMLELLCAGLSGSNFAFQAGSFFTEDGVQPRIGQLFIIFDPRKFNSNFASQAETLFTEILKQSGTRLPGTRRFDKRLESLKHGIEIDDGLLATLLELNV